MQTADMLDTNWMTFMSRSDMFYYGDAACHVIHCLKARATVGRDATAEDIAKVDRKVRYPP